ncbi:MAG: alanine racemase [Candidatus Nanopelagicales bacterium]|nr:alanine racemase [Candidatus Nanopelagicales bacterium]MDZ4248547.1 alanine racemase [Candidatus Nanopelagicales bacterium]
MERAAAWIDLGALARNIGLLRAKAGGAAFMAVVKADGYGHGMIPVARTARDAGAEFLGVALPSEAWHLRAVGDRGRLMAWLYPPSEDLRPCVATDVELGVSSTGMLDQVARAGAGELKRARVHLKVDTGLGRNGCAMPDWPDLVAAAVRSREAGRIEVVGIWSHLACGETPGSPVTADQVATFAEALDVAAELGVKPELRHLANTGGVLCAPATHFDLVRCGIGIYGLSPGPGQLGTGPELGLEPVMSVTAAVALVKEVPAGQGISYGHLYHTSGPTRLALVPVGYADGVPRAGSGVLPVALNGRRFTVAGAVAMDQVVLDVGDLPVAAGDQVSLFGPGADEAPTADDWAEACGTINYEIVTRLGSRIPRRYREGSR